MGLKSRFLPNAIVSIRINNLKHNHLAKLHKLALTCDWNEAQLVNNLRDKFMIGLYNKHLLQQLLTHDHKKSLKDLFQHPLTFKAAELKRSEKFLIPQQ